jgi:hypothetical protein
VPEKSDGTAMQAKIGSGKQQQHAENALCGEQVTKIMLAIIRTV